jgi:putative ABC transport system ATP-binding protein
VSERAVIRLEEITKTFETETVRTHALSAIELTVLRGEYIAIAGPSGCGKSTLLSILGLLDAATSGTYVLNGQTVTGLNAKQRAQVRNRDIGFIFQSFNLLGDRTVAQNVDLPLGYRGLKTSERRRLVLQALDRVGMTARADHYPAQLSGGQQQRVAVARAVVGDPSILLADEPTGNLDRSTAASVGKLLLELQREENTMLIVVTHSLELAALFDRRLELDAGRLVAH